MLYLSIIVSIAAAYFLGYQRGGAAAGRKWSAMMMTVAKRVEESTRLLYDVPRR